MGFDDTFHFFLLLSCLFFGLLDRYLCSSLDLSDIILSIGLSSRSSICCSVDASSCFFLKLLYLVQKRLILLLEQVQILRQLMPGLFVLLALSFNFLSLYTLLLQLRIQLFDFLLMLQL